MIDTPIRTLTELVDELQDLIDAGGKRVYADDLRDVLVRVDLTTEAALLDALNCEPWHFVGTYDEEVCFWCYAKRFSTAVHEATCPWARLSPHASAAQERALIKPGD